MDTTCRICNKRLVNPKLLPCFHIFCRDCVCGLKVGGIDKFKCPEECCKTTFTLENDDPETLPDAFPVFSEQELAESRAAVPKYSCRVHDGQQCESYCLDCLSFTCSMCAEDSKHRNHKKKNREMAWEACKDKLQERLPNVRLLNKRAESVAEDIKKVKVRVEERQIELASSIDNTFENLFKVLERRKAELHRQLNGSSTDKIASLLKQQREMQNFAGRLQRLEAFTDATIEQSTDIELLTNYEFLKIQMDQYIKEDSGVSTQPVQLANLALKNSALPHVKEVSHKHIRLYSKQANPSSCTAEGEGLIRAETFKVSRFHVNIHNRSHKPCTSEQDISVLVKCLENGYQESAEVVNKRQGTCEVKFCPQFQGEHEITVQVNGEHIMGSPFQLRVSKLPRNTIPDITGPRGITINHQGHLLICEWNGGRVVKLDKLENQVGEYGSGQLSHPASITLDRHCHFYVVDGSGEKSKVVKFHDDGRMLRSVGKKGKEVEEFENPRGIKINSKDEVFVCDRDNHRIQVFDLRLQFKRLIDLRALDSRLKLPAKPNDVAFDSGGTIFVTDFANHCILVLSKDEEYLYFFGNKASDDLTSPVRKMLMPALSTAAIANDDLAGPECITIDESNILYVTESGNHRVSVFRTTGELVARFGSVGRNSGELKFPMGITTDHNGSVYVCELLNNRVQMF